MKTRDLLVIIMMLLITISSCKKEFKENVSVPPSETSINKIKDWYQNQQETRSGTFNRTADIPVGTPDWDKTRYYMYPEKSFFIIPMRFGFDSTNANQFIFLEVNGAQEIINAEYVYILLDHAGENNYTKHELENLLPSAFELTKVPKELRAWIMKYDLDKKFIISKYLKNEEIIPSDCRFNSTKSGRAPVETCLTPLCIDWFYQIYENGVLIYEEYLYTTCNCFESGGGGGGNGDQTTCNLTQVQAQNVANQMYGDESTEHSGSGGITILSEDGDIITQGFTYKWTFYTLHYIAGYYSKWTAYYPGVRYKNNPNDQWKWQSVTFSGASQSGGTIPICFTTTCSAYSTAPIINPDGTASTTLTYTFNTQITCLGGLQVPHFRSGTISNNIITPY